jgi:cytochrome c oxidase assembly protein subunit 11
MEDGRQMTDDGRRIAKDGRQAVGGSVRSPPSVLRRLNRDIAVAAACGVFVAFMVGMSYAAVPLYSWFCKSTGFGGIPQIVTAAPAEISDRRITVRFDANLGAGLPWRFEPERTAIEVRLGEVVTIYYTVTNLSPRETAGQAVYNVTPTTVGGYFDKINCFCFTEQRLAPGEKREMAVVFYVDPALARDPEDDDLNTITLSYTFYALRPPRAGVADGATPAGPGRKI